MAMSMWPGRHFSREKQACKCGCGFNTVDAELIAVLEDLRSWCEHYPIMVNSGCRCERHNKAIGGSPRSQHLLGKAADIYCGHKTLKEIYDYLNNKYPGKYGVGLYNTFIHIDVREKQSRW